MAQYTVRFRTNLYRTGTGRELVRDETKTEPIFLLFYDVPFKVLFQSRPSPVPSSSRESNKLLRKFNYITNKKFWS